MASPAFYPDHDHDPRNLSHPYPPIPISTQTQTTTNTNTIYTHNASPIRPDSSSTLTVVQKSDDADSVTVRDVLSSRTPSPTPSEARELKTGAIDWKAILNWRFWIRREWAWYYVIIIILVTITALVSIFHKEIVQWLRPAATWLHKLPFGWLVPIGILFVISFPPLFGHEIVAILCGLVWGLWIGFGIVAAGTFLGEVGNFYAFKYCCRSRGEKLERTNTSYACLAKVVRDGGFRIALAARLSAIPGHFTTAVFSTCGMNIFVFSLAAILSLPKQFITVYLGVMLEQSESGQSTSTSKLISNIVLGITILITIGSMWYILHKMNKVKPDVIYAKRKARQAKLARAGLHPMSSDATLASEGGLEGGDEGMIPLKKKDKKSGSGNGNGVMFAAPQPQRPSAYTNPYDSYAAYEPSDSDPDSYNYAHPPTHQYLPYAQQPHNPYAQPQPYNQSYPQNQRSSSRGSRRSGGGRTRSGSGGLGGNGGVVGGLGGRGRGDVLSIVREDSEEVGWDMTPPQDSVTMKGTKGTTYSPIPPAREPNVGGGGGRMSSDNPYVSSNATSSTAPASSTAPTSTAPTSVSRVPPPTSTTTDVMRPPSQASHIITFDPDAVSVLSSAPNSPEMVLPTPPYSQNLFVTRTLNSPSLVQTQQPQSRHYPRTNPYDYEYGYDSSPFNDPTHSNPSSNPSSNPYPNSNPSNPSSTSNTTSNPNHLPIIPVSSPLSVSVPHISRSTPDLANLAMAQPMSAEVYPSFSEYQYQQRLYRELAEGGGGGGFDVGGEGVHHRHGYPHHPSQHSSQPQSSILGQNPSQNPSQPIQKSKSIHNSPETRDITAAPPQYEQIQLGSSFDVDYSGGVGLGYRIDGGGGGGHGVRGGDRTEGSYHTAWGSSGSGR